MSHKNLQQKLKSELTSNSYKLLKDVSLLTRSSLAPTRFQKQVGKVYSTRRTEQNVK